MPWQEGTGDIEADGLEVGLLVRMGPPAPWWKRLLCWLRNTPEPGLYFIRSMDEKGMNLRLPESRAEVRKACGK